MKYLLSCLLILATPAVQALDCCCGTPQCKPQCKPWIKAGLLILMPTVDDSYFTIIGPRTPDEEVPQGTLYSLQPDFKPGFTIEAGYEYAACRDVRINYQYFDNSYSRRLQASAGEAMFMTLVHPENSASEFVDGIAHNRSHFRYDQLDAELSTRKCLCDGFQTRFFGGLRWGHVRYREDITYIDPDDTGDTNIVNFGCLCGLGLFGDASC